MEVLRGKNVNDLYASGVEHLLTNGVLTKSRNGDVLVTPYPVMSVYERSYERVLFDQFRDCNPFFHVMESLWMLAGRDDAAFLNQFVADFGARYAEPDGSLHGAYGKRWRGHFNLEDESTWERINETDQLRYVVNALREDSLDRRVVIQMWDASADLGARKKDLPCNTQIYPRVVRGVLDITVMCRSNDIIWGAYGANAVHFSVLHEYLAAGVGVNVGRMYQLSNNFHGYVATMPQMVFKSGDPYDGGGAKPTRIVTNYEAFDEDVRTFCQLPTAFVKYENPFLDVFAAPMARAYALWRQKDRSGARHVIEGLPDSDWRRACLEWMDRRVKK